MAPCRLPLRLTFIFIIICYIRVLGQQQQQQQQPFIQSSFKNSFSGRSTSSAPTSVGKTTSPPITKSKLSYAYFSVTQTFIRVYNKAFAVPLSAQVLESTIQNVTNGLKIPGSIYINISSADYILSSSGSLSGNATVFYNLTYPFLQGSDYVYSYFEISNTILNSLKTNAFNKVYTNYCIRLQSGLLYSKASSTIYISSPAIFVTHSLQYSYSYTGTGSPL